MSQKILRTMQDDLDEAKDTKTGRGFFRKSEPAKKDKVDQKPLPTQATVSAATSKTKTPAQNIPAKTEKGNFTDLKRDLERKVFDVSMSTLPQSKKEDKDRDFFSKLQEKISKKKEALQEQPPFKGEPKIEMIKEVKKEEEIKKNKSEAVAQATPPLPKKESEATKEEEDRAKENVLSQIKKQEEMRQQEVQKATEAVKEQEALRQDEIKKSQEALKMQEIKITNILREVSDSMNQEESVAENSKREMEEIRARVLEEAKKNKEDILAQIRKQEELRRQEVQKAQDELRKQETLRAQEAKMAQQALREDDAKRAKESEKLRAAIASQEAEIANLIKRTANPLNKEDLIEEMRAKMLEDEKKNNEQLLAQMKAQETQLANFMQQVSDTLNKNTPNKDDIEQEIINKIKAEEEKTKQDLFRQFKAQQTEKEAEAAKLQETIREKDTQISNLVKGISESLQEESDEGEAKEKLINEMQTKIATLEEEKTQKENALAQVEEAARQKAEEEIKKEAEKKLAEEEERLQAERQTEEALEAEKRREEERIRQEAEAQKASEQEEERMKEEAQLKEEEERQKLLQEEEEGRKKQEEEMIRKEEEAQAKQAETEEQKAKENEERLRQEEEAKQAAEEERLKQEEAERIQKEEQATKATKEEEEKKKQKEAASAAATITVPEEAPKTEEPQATAPEVQPSETANTETPKGETTDSNETFWNALRQDRGIDTGKTESAPMQNIPTKSDSTPQETQVAAEIKPSEVTLAKVHDEDITELIKRVSGSMETPGTASPEKPQELIKPDKDRDLKDLLSRMSKNLQREKIAIAEKKLEPTAAKLGPAAADYLAQHPESAQYDPNVPAGTGNAPQQANTDNNYWQKLQNTSSESAISPQQRMVGGTNYGSSPYDQPSAPALPNDNAMAMPEEVKNAQMRIQDRRKMQSDYANPENRLIFGKQEFYSTMHKAITPKTRMESLEGLDEVLKDDEIKLSDEEEKKRLKQSIVSKYGIKLFRFPWIRVIVITVMFLAIIGGSLALILPKLSTPPTKELAPVVVGKSISDIDKKISPETFVKQKEVSALNFFDANLSPWNKYNNGDIIRLNITYDNQDLMLSRSEALKSVLGEDNADNIPQDFMDATSPEYNVLVFKEGGALRLALVFKFTASDGEGMKDIMSSWEKTNTKSKKIYTVMKNLFVNSRIIEQESITFQSAIYNSTTLKFINLPDSDTSMDYFIYEGYIVFTSSKDHTFQLIDKLKS